VELIIPVTLKYSIKTGAAHKNRHFPQITEVDISVRAQEWLKLSADHLPGGRHSRNVIHNQEN